MISLSFESCWRWARTRGRTIHHPSVRLNRVQETPIPHREPRAKDPVFKCEIDWPLILSHKNQVYACDKDKNQIFSMWFLVCKTLRCIIVRLEFEPSQCMSCLNAWLQFNFSLQLATSFTSKKYYISVTIYPRYFYPLFLVKIEQLFTVLSIQPFPCHFSHSNVPHL